MTIAIVALALAVLVLVLLLLVLVGAQHEAPWSELDTNPPTVLAGLTRKLLGVYVRKDMPGSKEAHLADDTTRGAR